MTQQQRRATRNALARYGQRGYRQTFEGPRLEPGH